MSAAEDPTTCTTPLVRAPEVRTMKRFDKRHLVVCHRTNGGWMKLPAEFFQEVDTSLTAGDLDLSSVVDDLSRRTGLSPAVVSGFIDNLLDNRFYISGDEETCAPWDHAYVFVTTRCNLRCRHCSGSWESAGEDLSVARAEKLIEWIRGGRSVGRVVFTGGEPLLNPSLPAILELFRSGLDSGLHVQTNGTLLTPEWVDLFLRLDVDIEISLDGYDAESVSLIRGPGVYDRVMKNIAMLRERGFDGTIGMSMTTTRHTVDGEEAFRTLCESVGAFPQVRLIVPLGRAAEHKELLEPLPEQFDPLAVSMKTVQSLPALDPCGGFLSYFAVGVDGDVYPCPNLMEPEFRAGNIGDPSGLCLENSPGARALNEHRVDNHATCASCDVRYLCNNGGCFSSNRALHGSLSMCGSSLCHFHQTQYSRWLWGPQ